MQKESLQEKKDTNASTKESRKGLNGEENTSQKQHLSLEEVIMQTRRYRGKNWNPHPDILKKYGYHEGN
jgi:hypothetical protein